jgi:paraquat-inducible protein B
MSRQASPVAIGGFVLGALALIVLAILVLSSGTLFRSKTQVVSYFPGTIQGLTVGSRVEFQGVPVGEVTEIRLDYHPNENEFLIPVRYEIWQDNVTIAGERTEEIEGKAPLRYLVENQGLRAQLEVVSLVTGQYLVALKIQPETPVAYVGEDKTRIEIPTIEAARDRFSSMMQGLDLSALANKATEAFEAIKSAVSDPALRALLVDADKTLLEFKRLAADVNTGITPLLERADSAVDDYAELAQIAGRRLNTLADSIEQTSAKIDTLSGNIDRQVVPVSKSAVDAFGTVESLIGEGSATRYDLDLLLEEGASAARSLRLLADYLEQNPDALIKGKYGGR